MFNRLTWAKKLAEDLTIRGIEVILVDNCSTYPPLLEWYKTCPYKVHHMEQNVRAFGFFGSNVLSLFGNPSHYMVTDHDLDISSLPHDFVDVLQKGLDLFPDIWKCGVSLEINDLPKGKFADKVIEWESMFWRNEDRGYYPASVATTLALYRGASPKSGDKYSGVRAARPYTVKHLSWYQTKAEIEASEEEMYYYSFKRDGWTALNY